MSIRRIQIQRVLEDAARSLYSTGVVPTLNAVFTKISKYFAAYPAGSPLPMPLQYIRAKEVSDVDKFNQILAHINMNLDVLYEESLGQVNEVMLLTATLQSDLERLRSRRRRVETLIDDYLLSLYNTDGYYFSISDTFSDTSMTDLSLTSAYIDTVMGSVTLPTIGSLSRRMEPTSIVAPSVSVTSGGRTLAYSQIAPWSGAVDGFTNTVWEINTSVSTPDEVVAVLDIPFTNLATISRIDFDPYGISEVQAFVELKVGEDFIAFGNKIETSSNKMSFVDTARDADAVRITLRKTKFDYVESTAAGSRYRYVFGAKDITIVEQVYDTQAIFVSQPLAIPADLQDDMVIDAVSLEVNADISPDTDIVYSVAAEGDSLDWQRIHPIGGTSDAGAVVRFRGANTVRRMITTNPSGSDLKLIPLDSTNSDLSKRNPSPNIIPGVDTYRIAAFDDDAVSNSMVLEEGINTTRIYHTGYVAGATDTLEWWADRFGYMVPPLVTYGRIDAGHEFFYGGDVGETNRSVFIETTLESLDDRQPLLAELRKADPNSRYWEVRVFLNGREIGWLPVGVDKLLIPWTFQQGTNHIALLIHIPAATPAVPTPYIGMIDLLGGKNLYDFGTVKLGTWTPVSFFDLKYNQTGNPNTFSLVNGEIVARRKPTTQFRLSYAKSTKQGPTAVRLRADLTRSSNNIHVTPKLNSYRLRFSYGDS